MRFAPTEEQLAFADAARSLAERHSSPDAVREAWKTGKPPVSLWNGLQDLGLLSLLAAEDAGGGGSELELMAAFYELGRAATPGPIVEHAAVAVPLLSEFEPSALSDPEFSAHGITASQSDVVPYLRSSSVLLINSSRVSLLKLTDIGELPHTDALDESRLVGELSAQQLESARVIAAGPHIRAAVERAEDRAALATASMLLGLSAKAVELTVEYTSSRRQFGVPIGSFQAVKHHMANAHGAIEMARPVVEAAAWEIANSTETTRQTCSMAKVVANKAARQAAKSALQCHGAIGYTMEADLHLYLMRIWSLINAWGTTDYHRQRVIASWKQGEAEANLDLPGSVSPLAGIPGQKPVVPVSRD